jgi:hypothetical protein
VKVTFDQDACGKKGYKKTSNLSKTSSTSPEPPISSASVTSTPQDHNDQVASNEPRNHGRIGSVIDGDRPDLVDNPPAMNKLKQFVCICHYFRRFFRLSQPEIHIISNMEWDDERILQTLRQVYMAKRGKFKQWFHGGDSRLSRMSKYRASRAQI